MSWQANILSTGLGPLPLDVFQGLHCLVVDGLLGPLVGVGLNFRGLGLQPGLGAAR